MEEKEVTTPQNEEQIEKQTEGQIVESAEPTDVATESVTDAENAENGKKKKTKKEKKSKQKDLSQYENLSDDELYAKIQTDKLLKKKKNRRIATIVGMCFAFALAVVIIVLAAVPVSLKPRFIDGGFDQVKLYPGTANADASFSVGTERYDEFMKIYNEAFSQSYISAIFNGSLFTYSIEENTESAGENGTQLPPSFISNNSYFVELRFTEPQTFTKQNGGVFHSKLENRWWTASRINLQFTTAYLEVKQSEGWQNVNVYVVGYYPNFNTSGSLNETDPYDYYYIEVTVRANTNLIYEAWDDLCF